MERICETGEHFAVKAATIKRVSPEAETRAEYDGAQKVHYGGGVVCRTVRL